MRQLIETIEGKIWSVIDNRAFEHDGCVVDIGCLHWDWSRSLFGRKRVIGVDPVEDVVPDNVELFKGRVGPFDAKVSLSRYLDASSVAISSMVAENPNESQECEFAMLSWKNFCKNNGIDRISVLKINIEGGEYPLLHSMDSEDFEKIDQIVVSFHHWIDHRWLTLTKSSLGMLEELGFEIIQTHREFGWYLCVKK